MSAPPGAPRERHLALDVARGLAVFGMIYVHLVPTEGALVPLGRLATAFARFLEGRSAALFCILAGMSWAIQAARAESSGRFGRYVARRALALAAAGALFHLVWPTEILLPLALMMVLALMIGRGGARAVATAAALLVAAAPIAATVFHGYFTSDWLADGSHLADHSLGLATLRFYFVDGNYPIVPWLVFPLVGMTMLAGDRPRVERARGWFWLALALVAGMQVWSGWTRAHGEELGALAPYASSTWVPTTIPFLLLTGGSAITVLSGLIWWHAERGLPFLARPVALLGRSSLTHYVVHVCAVIVPLRLVWPDEEWPVRVGAWAFLGYVAIALPLTELWFRRFSHGPLEGLWAMASGRRS